MLKKLSLSLAIIFLSLGNSLAVEYPSVEFERYIEVPNNFKCVWSAPQDGYIINRDSCISYTASSSFERNLGKNKQEILDFWDKLLDDFDAKIKSRKLKNYELLIFRYTHTYTSSKRIDKITYVLKDGKVIGYNLITKMLITDFDSNKYVAPEITKIKSLAKDLSYANTSSFNNLNFDFYKKSHTDFVEIYSILTNKTKNEKYLYLDAFYPKELDEHFKRVFNRVSDKTFSKGMPANFDDDSDEEL